MTGLPGLGEVTGARRQALIGVLAVVALAGAFVLGRSTGGVPLRPGAAERGAPTAAGLERENRELSAKVARLEMDATVDREGYAQVEQQLVELQGKIIEQQEELAFYRGIIGGPGEGGLKVQDFAVAAAAPGAATLRFVLAQPGSAEREVQGRLQIRVEGTRGGRLVSLDVAQLGAVAPEFRVRYFQDFALELRLPADFEPQRIVIRVLPATRGIRDSVVSFPWAAA